MYYNDIKKARNIEINKNISPKESEKSYNKLNISTNINQEENNINNIINNNIKNNKENLANNNTEIDNNTKENENNFEIKPKDELNFSKYFCYKLTCGKKYKNFKIYENFRKKVISEEQLAKNYLNVYNLVKENEQNKEQNRGFKRLYTIKDVLNNE